MAAVRRYKTSSKLRQEGLARPPTGRMRFSSILPFCLAPMVSALTLNIPSNLVIGQPTTITWVSGPNDWPRWTLFLMGVENPFDLRQIVGEDIDPSIGSITTTFPTDRVNAGNVDWVLANSPIFELHA
ncbi:hypothetical protein FPV67DRAFT_1443216 [Lyophyllum atratum]|nr:hypothetical protein FPV67DRAFT_1443216 [Lyophyllum atratum]